MYEEAHAHPTQPPPTLISRKTGIKPHKQETDTATIDGAYSDFTNPAATYVYALLYVWVCVCIALCNFITRGASWGRHNQYT